MLELTGSRKLNRNEELEMGRRWKEHDDEKALGILINSHKPLVVGVARRYAHKLGVPTEDLLQEGNIGLWKAAVKFDYKRGYRFQTYAFRYINGAILEYIKRHYRLVRVPDNISKKISQLVRLRSRFEQAGQEPTVWALARKLHWRQEEVEFILLQLSGYSVSIDAPAFKESAKGESTRKSVCETMIDSGANPEEILVAKEANELRWKQLKMAMKKLTPNERKIICLRHLREGRQCVGGALKPALTLTELGRRLGFSRQRAQQLEDSAIKKLRAGLEGAEF